MSFTRVSTLIQNIKTESNITTTAVDTSQIKTETITGDRGELLPHTSTPLKASTQLYYEIKQESEMVANSRFNVEKQNKSTRFLGNRAVSILSKWFHTNKNYPYPDEATTDLLAKEAEISSKQVKKWFANKRVRSQSCCKPVHRQRKQHRLSNEGEHQKKQRSTIQHTQHDINRNIMQYPIPANFIQQQSIGTPKTPTNRTNQAISPPFTAAAHQLLLQQQHQAALARMQPMQQPLNPNMVREMALRCGINPLLMNPLLLAAASPLHQQQQQQQQQLYYQNMVKEYLQQQQQQQQLQQFQKQQQQQEQILSTNDKNDSIYYGDDEENSMESTNNNKKEDEDDEEVSIDIEHDNDIEEDEEHREIIKNNKENMNDCHKMSSLISSAANKLKLNSNNSNMNDINKKFEHKKFTMNKNRLENSTGSTTESYASSYADSLNYSNGAQTMMNGNMVNHHHKNSTTSPSISPYSSVSPSLSSDSSNSNTPNTQIYVNSTSLNDHRNMKKQIENKKINFAVIASLID